jgi:haloalkane dehalogenase
MSIEFLRTPDERFRRLSGYPFEPHYAEICGLRIHYVDEGPRDGSVVLLLHGEPSWSYLYRKMIPVLTAAGHRAIAPDLAGFGRSDKPVRMEDYSYQFHVDMMAGLVETLDLRDAALVGQDWGGLIGLRVSAGRPERFARIVAANTGLPTGDTPMPEAFHRWRAFSQSTPDLPIGRIVQGGCTAALPAEVIHAYEAPFPDLSYKAGARIFPMLVPARPDDPASQANRNAWRVLRAWNKPFLTAFSDHDPITAGGDRLFQSLIPGAQGQPHTVIRGAGHFLQEDKGEELARVIADFLARASAKPATIHL